MVQSLYMQKLNMRLLDSIHFLPMDLAKLPELSRVKRKDIFPHFFNTAENQAYVGKYPSVEYYGADSMKPKYRDKFLKWHGKQQGNIFNFSNEIVAYCQSDVRILRLACLYFRRLVMQTTAKIPDSFPQIGEFVQVENNDEPLSQHHLDSDNNEQTTAEPSCGQGLDPFNSLTLA
eukprot:GHVU01172622.1.p1 GENE.GHVU01172622.1~~GHVU01172622.1.p1  ORF type:complete len:175 (-),score=11.20 GHVU01172622.1:310-834(-)